MINLWKEKYELNYCELCDCCYVICPDCKNSSCNGGGCENCRNDFIEFGENKISASDYLSEEDKKAIYRGRKLKKFLILSLEAGFKEVNWEFIKKEKVWCEIDIPHFPQLK